MNGMNRLREAVGREPFAPMALDTEQLKKFAREHDGEDSGARDVNGKPIIIGHQVDVAGFDGKFAGVRGKVLGAETRRVVLILHANGLSGQHSSNHIREE